MELDDEVVRQAALRAADMLSGMGYLQNDASRHTLRRRTLTTALQRLIAWQITELDPRWSVRKAGSIRPFLLGADGRAVQLRVTSSKRRLVHKIMALAGTYVVVRYSLTPIGQRTAVDIAEIRMADIGPDDWICTGRPVRAFSNLKPGGD
jgi:hypothetical protein